MKKFIALLLATLLLIEPAAAWNKPGHMVTGAITYQLLKESDPGALVKLVDLLRQHPQYESMWLPQIKQFTSSQEEADQYLFMLAARWPDDARDSEYNHSDWHYVNFPFRHGQSVTAPASIGGKLIEAYGENLAIIKGDAAASRKAVALCWILHLVGDLHQPLHTSTLISEQFPEGDRGGTRFYVKARGDSRTISLHAFWDDLITGTPRFREALNVATGLRNRRAFKRSAFGELATLGFNEWAMESYGLARNKAYLGGKLQGGDSKEEGAQLPADYSKAAKAVAERQAVLACHRLSNLLASLY